MSTSMTCTACGCRSTDVRGYRVTFYGHTSDERTCARCHADFVASAKRGQSLGHTDRVHTDRWELCSRLTFAPACG